jgi:hypothetical protein
MLFREKWFDYRTMHPTEATYLFAHHYRQEYKGAVAKAKDVEKAQYVKGFRGEDLFKLAAIERTGFWKARQSADRMGCEYSFYIREAMNYTLSRNWKNLPRPQQLYSKEMTERIEEKWLDKLNASITVPEDEFFTKAERFVGQCDQVDFQNYLVDQIKAKMHPEFAIYHYLECGMLVSDFVEREFGKAFVKQATTTLQ